MLEPGALVSGVTVHPAEGIARKIPCKEGGEEVNRLAPVVLVLISTPGSYEMSRDSKDSLSAHADLSVSKFKDRRNIPQRPG